MPSYDMRRALKDICGGGFIDKRGWFIASCPNPFHRDSSPSFGYNLTSNGFNCFSCDLKGYGGLSALVMAVYDVNKFTALEMLTPYRIGSTEEGKLIQYRDALTDKVIKQLYEVNSREAQEYYQGNYGPQFAGLVCKAWEEPYTEAQEYALGRGFLPSTLEHFHVHTWEFAKSHKLFIPMVWNGVVWGFQRRETRDNAGRLKYLSMDGMDTVEYLYGEAQEGKHPFLVIEGATDAWKAWQNGVRSFGAVLSSSISEAQAATIAQYASVVICGSDNDNAGQKLYTTMLGRMRKHAIPVVRMWFSGEDPASIRDEEFSLAWEDALERANEFLDAKKIG